MWNSCEAVFIDEPGEFSGFTSPVLTSVWKPTVNMELESLISEGQRLGPVLIAGDFNAHLGPLGGIRGQGIPNQQGVLLKQLLDRCELHVVSLSSLSEGPFYTFWNHEETGITIPGTE